MTFAKVYIASGSRLLPLSGGPAVLPPTDPTPPPEPPPPPTGNKNAMLVGAAPATLSGSDFDSLDAAAGPWTVRRSYEDAAVGFNFANWAASRGGIDVGKRASVWSCKPDLAGMGSGAYDSKIQAFVSSIPDTHVAFLSVWHEVDGKIRKGTTDPSGATITKAAWLPAIQKFCNAVHSVGKPHVYTCMILEAWSGQHPQAGTTYADLWPGPGYIDAFVVDGYSNTGSGSTLWGPAVDFASRQGIPWGIGELGCASTVDTSWMTAQADYAAAHGTGGRVPAAFMCWFSNTTGGVLATPGTDPSMQATSKTISQTYYADVNSFVL
jgi:hypothetical protein